MYEPYGVAKGTPADFIVNFHNFDVLSRENNWGKDGAWENFYSFYTQYDVYSCSIRSHKDYEYEIEYRYPHLLFEYYGKFD